MGPTVRKAAVMTSTTGPSLDRRASGGFTLLELIAVLVLISTLLAIAAPSLRGFARGRRTADSAARILSLTHLARSRAASWGCVHRLNVDAETGTYWLTVQQAGAFVEIETDQGRRYRLPVGVSISLDVPSAAESPSYVQFYPDGRCDPAVIQLADAEGQILHVTSPSPSERFRIVSAAEDERL
jgi:prepilin-type N-terminal cleavage/methylation domain-containing protein